MLIGWWKKTINLPFCFCSHGRPASWLSALWLPSAQTSALTWLEPRRSSRFWPGQEFWKGSSQKNQQWWNRSEPHLPASTLWTWWESVSGLVDFFFFYAFTNWPAFSKLIMLHSGTRGRQDGRNGFSIAGTICPEAPAGRRRYEMFFCSQNSLTDRSQDKCK